MGRPRHEGAQDLLEYEHFGFASVEHYLEHGTMLPSDWFEVLRGFDAIFFGAVGWPDLVPDHPPVADGDEVRAIDWNVTARTGQLFIKRYIGA